MTNHASDRRGLLRAGAAALTTSLFTGKIRGANDKVNVAFIGTGKMGSANIGYAGKTPGIQIVSVCDIYQPALEKARYPLHLATQDTPTQWFELD